MIIAVFLVFIFMLIGCGKTEETNAPAQDEKVTITDMAGRKVTIPAKVTKVYGASPVETILLYTMAPDKLAGWNYKLSDLESKMMPEKYKNLPVLGGWYGQGNTGNIEEILKAKPDVILAGHSNNNNLADKLQKDLNIPVVCVDDKISDYSKIFSFLGKVLGEEKQAKKMADIYEKAMADFQKVKSIPEKVKVYYAEGPKGLQTDPSGSQHAELIDLAGATNVADVKLLQGYGRTEVSFEQVLKWNPDVIIVGEIEFYQQIFKDEKWKQLNAVKNKRVHLIPRAPFNWFDRPPAVSRIIGMYWVSHILYPQQFSDDIKDEVKAFYETFYHHQLTDQEYKDVLTLEGVVKDGQ